jgi:DNA-binding GntR family transcriptional regulator
MSTTKELAPVMYRSLPETVTDRLRRAIINGELPAEERLVESDLAARLGVSRATVRQAIRQLEVERLVEIRPRRGAVVSRMSRADATAVCEARGLLEGFLARSACCRLDDDAFLELGALAAEMGTALEAGDVFRVVELDIAFHELIASRGQNRRVYELWSVLNSQVGALLSSTVEFRRMTPEQVVLRHELLCKALKQKDPDRAERAVRSHYVDVWPDENP